MNKEQFTALGLTDEQATKAAEASQEELKGFIPKSRFDEVNEANKQLKATSKEHETQLETLKKSAGDNAELQKQIETLQADNTKKDQDYQAQLKELQLSNAIKLSVSDKAQDADLVAGLIDKSKLILGDDGKVTGLDEQLKGLQESKAFLFKQTDTTQQQQQQQQQQQNTPGFKIGADGTNQGGDINSQLSSIFGNDKK